MLSVKTFKRLWHDDSGLSVLEYGIAAAAIAVIVGVVMTVFKEKLKTIFGKIDQSAESAANRVAE